MGWCNQELKKQLEEVEERTSRVQKHEILTKVKENQGLISYPAVSIYTGIMPDHVTANVRKYVDETNNNLHDKRLIANISGDQSTLDITDPLMEEFYALLHESACTYQNYHTDEERNIVLNGCWSVKMNPGDHNPLHMHTTDSFSGLATIFYVKVPAHIRENVVKGFKNENESYRVVDGMLSFVFNGQPCGRQDDYNQASDIDVIPEEGMYYIFPKWLMHTVWPFRGTEQRWSVQTNFECYSEKEWKQLNHWEKQNA